MKSPFPGMDPYIEACGLWGDFHDDLIGEIKRALANSLPPPYVVRTSARSYVELVETEGKTKSPFLPDVNIVSPRSSPAPSSPGQVEVAEPPTDSETVSLRAFVAEHFRESFVEVYYQSDALQLVTSIEVLSPSNKRKGSEGWLQYLQKRQAHLVGEANLIEIDLLRGGDKFPMLDPWPQSPYTLLVSRRLHAPRCQVTKAHYLRPLPVLPIPLAYPDPDSSLALQPMIEAIYQRAQYAISIDYRKPCVPPLGAEDSAWLQEQVKAQSSG